MEITVTKEELLKQERGHMLWLTSPDAESLYDGDRLMALCNSVHKYLKLAEEVEEVRKWNDIGQDINLDGYYS